MKKLRYVITPAFVLAGMMAFTAPDVYADNESYVISVSNPNPNVGDVINITVTASSTDIIWGGGYSVYVNGVVIDTKDLDNVEGSPTQVSYTVQYTVSAEGTYTVSMSGDSSLVVSKGDISEGNFVSVPVTASQVTFTAQTPTQPSETQPSDTQPPETQPSDTQPSETQPSQTQPSETQPSQTQPSQTQPSQTQPSETQPQATITGIEVSYAGGEKKAGDTVSGLELSVNAVYSDGTKQPLNGWACAEVGQPLKEGDNVFTVVYQGMKAEFTVKTPQSESEPSSEDNTASSEEETSESQTDESNESSADDTTESKSDSKIPYIQITDPFGTGDLYLASDWNTDKPSGYEDFTIKYSGYDVKALKNDAGLTLVYMTDSKGENGSFYIYDEDTGRFSFNTPIQIEDNAYYILQFPDSFDAKGLPKISLSINGNALTAYQLSNSDADGIVCLVYAVDSNGSKGYFRFDTQLKTFVRYYPDRTQSSGVSDGSGDTSSDSANDSELSKKYTELAKAYRSDSLVKFYIIIALIVLAAILFVFVIVLALKLKKIYSEYDFVDDDGDDTDDDSDEDSDDEDEDEDDEDSDEDSSYIDEDFRVDLSGIEDSDEDDK